jgi:hypothetical protein
MSNNALTGSIHTSLTKDGYVFPRDWKYSLWTAPGLDAELNLPGHYEKLCLD